MGRYPIPNKANEVQGVGAGPVVTYKLSPEELKRYQSIGKPRKEPVPTELEIKKRIMSLKSDLDKERQARIQLEQELEEIRQSRAQLEQELERIRQRLISENPTLSKRQIEIRDKVIHGLIKAMILLVEVEKSLMVQRGRGV